MKRDSSEDCEKEVTHMEKLVFKTACKAKPASTSSKMEVDRKISTGTLNRLILVAQALESEVETRRNDDVSATKITFSIRIANMVLLILINVLIFTGFGKYQNKNHDNYQDLRLTADKWTYEPKSDELPETFLFLRLSGQACVTLLEPCHFSLFVFGLEMHYSTCPWLDEYFMLYRESDLSSQCAINGWALAGVSFFPFPLRVPGH
ncbi:unnamed protein product [Caenorhabditis auriculariae]|uniref:Uncharacterized protein n=1 Tax=Caenorhabditis auriculariae TaxID=2777116 RepID=A0A8S1H0X7_9PELO|nr:unnamed protein product [Caenorhabditis auriculariae]